MADEKPRYRYNPANLAPRGGRSYTGIGETPTEKLAAPKNLSRDPAEDLQLAKGRGPIAPKRAFSRSMRKR
jgi:hypothetical protein